MLILSRITQNVGVRSASRAVHCASDAADRAHCPPLSAPPPSPSPSTRCPTSDGTLRSSKKLAGSAMTSIVAPSARQPIRHPIDSLTSAAISGIMANPSPRNMLTTAIARPRRRTNHRATTAFTATRAIPAFIAYAVATSA